MCLHELSKLPPGERWCQKVHLIFPTVATFWIFFLMLQLLEACGILSSSAVLVKNHRMVKAEQTSKILQSDHQSLPVPAILVECQDLTFSNLIT